jgi:hypothetical protein
MLLAAFVHARTSLKTIFSFWTAVISCTECLDGDMASLRAHVRGLLRRPFPDRHAGLVPASTVRLGAKAQGGNATNASSSLPVDAGTSPA